jgi:hypothetical protein
MPTPMRRGDCVGGAYCGSMGSSESGCANQTREPSGKAPAERKLVIRGHCLKM